MKKRNTIIGIAVAVVAIAVGGLFVFNQQKAESKTNNVKIVKPSKGSTATLFFHGWGSSSRAEDFMAQGLKNSGATKTIIKANVSPKMKVTFNRNFSAKTKNPVIEVNIEDNKLAHLRGKSQDYSKVYAKSGNYVKAAVQAVEKKTKSNKINLVGHSMGNLEIINYINSNATKKNFPYISHLVAIAGHYNGIVGQEPNYKVNAKTGKPVKMDRTYRKLLPIRHKFPRNIRVLNIYGDKGDGSHSDGSVYNNSSKSLKYLLNGRAKSYREVKMTGKNASHSRLHSNIQVNDQLIKFLFSK